MATMVTGTKEITKKGKRVADRGSGKSGPNGHGSRGNGGDPGGGDLAGRFEPDRYRIGMWVALAGIAMLFTALTSAYIVRAGWVNDRRPPDWRPLVIPRLLWLSTALIVLSSITFEIARKGLKRGEESVYGRWLLATVFLGLGFLASQFVVWRQLVGQGVYMSSNPHVSFFYLLTAAHGLHLLGGIFALDYLLIRTWRKRQGEFEEKKRLALAGAVSLYWHFMDGLWIYLFLLLFFWR
ncbi:MAG TPA: cytochrome c oxidase subunit 3 [Pyrinomonadaceae bacterium]|nr:cytochrome c oxidase subunit 3 [Pyrinomonadaceae bacterium]